MAEEKQARTRSSSRAKGTRDLGSAGVQKSAFSPKQDFGEHESAYDDRHDRIAALAYALYERSGRQEGYDLDNWLEAEQQILNLDRRNGGSESPRSRA